MKTKHEINVNNLMNWKAEREVEFAGSYDEGSHKSLVATLSGNYKVYHQREVVLNTSNPNDAINKYNELP